MGLDSIVVGKIYFLEMMLIGISSVGVGSCSGVFLSKFFQMIVFKVAGFNVDVKFNVTMDSILYTLIIFMTIFLFFSIKGFINILRSSVIDLLKDSKKSDNMPKITIITYIIAVFSLILIFYGYYLIANDSGKSVETLICICVGTYGLYGSIFPIILNILIKRKSFLYSSESIIMINSLAYRVKKNYRTYAVISILIACTITVLGLAVSLKKLYSTSIENSELYSISFLSKEEINNKENIEKVIEKIGDEKYKLSTTVLKVNVKEDDIDKSSDDELILLSYTQLRNILKTSRCKEELNNIDKSMVEDNNIIYIKRPGTLVSSIRKKDIKIGSKVFKIANKNIRLKTLGSALNYPTVVVSDDNYNKLVGYGEKIKFFGLKVENEEKFLDDDNIKYLNKQLSDYVNMERTKVNVGVYELKKVDYLRVVYAIGAFLFLVFMLAVASIIYIKIYSDANEDKSKYKILKDIGIEKRKIRKSINREMLLVHFIPVVIGGAHSYFAIKSLGEMLSIDLTMAFLWSMVIAIILFGVNSIISIKNFKRIVEV